MRFSLFSLAFIFLLSSMAKADELNSPSATQFKLPVPSVMSQINSAPAQIKLENIKEDEILFRVPFKYKRTAILKADYYEVGLFGGKVLKLKAGAKGYWAGTFFMSHTIGASTYSMNEKSEVWCFFGKKQEDEDSSACFQDAGSLSYQLETPRNPYIVSSFSKGTIDFAIERPSFEETPDAFGKPLEFIYKVTKIKKDKVIIKLELDGKYLDEFHISSQKNGSFYYESPIGDLDVNVAPDNKSVSFTKRPMSSESLSNEKKPEAEKINAAIDKLEALLKFYEKGNKFKVSFIDRPEISETAKTFKRGELIAQQKYLPSAAYMLKSEIKEQDRIIGEKGSILFPIDPSINYYDYKSKFKNEFAANLNIERKTPPLLCGFDTAKVKRNLEKHKDTMPSAFCLGDNDGDGRYEYLWRSVEIFKGSIYGVFSLGFESKLSDDTYPGAAIESANNTELPPEIIGIYNSGASGENLDSAGNIKPSEVVFEYKYLTRPTLQFEVPFVFERFAIHLNQDGQGSLIVGDETKTEVKKINPDGSIDIIFRDFYPIGEAPIADYERKRAIIKEKIRTLEKMRDDLSTK